MKNKRGQKKKTFGAKRRRGPGPGKRVRYPPGSSVLPGVYLVPVGSELRGEVANKKPGKHIGGF